MAQALSVRRTLQAESVFLSDMFAPNMLYGLTIRSTSAHAEVEAFTVPDLPRDISCLRAGDIPGENRVRLFSNSAPLLTEQIVRYAGEPLAILTGPSPTRLIQIAGEIDIRYRDLEVVTDAWNAPSGSVVAERTRSRGDVDRVMRSAERQVVGNYITGIQDHLYSEPAGAYAVRDDKGIVTVFSPSQWPHHVRETVARMLGIPEQRCRVRSTESGVHLDGKLWYPSVLAAHAALAAVHTGKPVKLIYTREEDFRFSPKGMAVKVDCTTGLDAEGSPVASDIVATVNLGAYPLFTDEIVSRLAAALVFQYQVPACRVRVRAVTTNLPPLNACGGLGTSHALFAVETHASRLTEITESAPPQWKQEQLHRKGNQPLIGDLLSADLDANGLVERVAVESDFNRKHAAFELQKKRRASFRDLLDPPRGIGIAFGHQVSGFLGRGEEEIGSEVRVRLEKDGSGELVCGSVTEGESMRTLWKQNLVSLLNVAEGDIQLKEPDTAYTTDGGPSVLSRNIAVIHRTIEAACNAIKKKRFRTPLPIEITRSFRPARSVVWNPQTLEGSPYGPVSFAAAVVEVEVSPVSYEARVRGVWLAVDAGRILQREQAKRVLERGVFHALSWSGIEELSIPAQGLSRADYHRYQHARLPAICPVWIDFLGDSEKAQPRGLGDLPLACVPAAFAAAVTQATGRYVDQIPCTADTLHDYLEEATDES